MEANLQDLHRRVHRSSYRAKPVRRHGSSTEAGGEATAGVTALEDKILAACHGQSFQRDLQEDSSGFVWVPAEGGQ